MAARARRKIVPEAAPVTPPKPKVGSFTIHDLSLFRCRFICSADGAPVRYCGHPTVPGPGNKHGSWCDEHRAVVFTPRPVLAARKAGRA